MQGKVLAGRYRLVSKLGQGGMGSVWRAEHLALHSEVAVKLIDAQIATSREALSRFEREAQAAAELRSTHIVQILDYGIDQQVPYIVMELLEGVNLSDRMRRAVTLAPRETALYLSQVARALNRAHEKGIVHRDLKPENVFIAREGADEVVKVLDFGIAKRQSLTQSDGVKTHTGALLGTPYYMSPEQALGQTDIDVRTDIWSFGVIAFECLTGLRPFERSSLGALLMAICNEPLPVPSNVASVPAGFDEWFARAVARERSARFQSILEAASDFQRVVHGSETSRPPEFQSKPPAAAISESAKPLSAFSESAGPASVTISGLPKKSSPKRLALFVAAALVSAVPLSVWVLRTNDAATSVSTSAVAHDATSSSAPPLDGASATLEKPTAASAPDIDAGMAGSAPASSAPSLVASAGAPTAADRGSAPGKTPNKKAQPVASAPGPTTQVQPTAPAQTPAPTPKTNSSTPSAPTAEKHRSLDMDIK